MRLKAYSKIVRGLVLVLAGIYEMVYGEPAPKPSDALRG